MLQNDYEIVQFQAVTERESTVNWNVFIQIVADVARKWMGSETPKSCLLFNYGPWLFITVLNVCKNRAWCQLPAAVNALGNNDKAHCSICFLFYSFKRLFTRWDFLIATNGLYGIQRRSLHGSSYSLILRNKLQQCNRTVWTTLKSCTGIFYWNQ